MQEFTKEHTPAEIVKVFPKASDLFKTQKIDFCCGGLDCCVRRRCRARHHHSPVNADVD